MEAPVAEIKPDIKKAFLYNILRVAGVVALVVGTLIYLNIVVGLDLFLDSFAQMGITISTTSFISWFIFLIIFSTAILLILNYVNLGKLTYTLYPDKIVYNQSFFIMQTKDKTIPYANIAKITYKDRALLNTSKITIDLTGTNKPNIELDFIDDAQEVVGKIQELVRDYKANYYAKYAQDKAIRRL